ncbi:MAG: nucleoside hydrolase [Pseudomonadales bacterium]|nr:nucleoside hydrolase [Pseudomonadales bacterium]
MKVVFNHDAAIDEYIAGVLLTTLPNIELSDIIITNGDCVAGPAMNAAYKIQQFINSPANLVSLALSRSWNQFPWEYRKDSVTLNTIACLSDIPTDPDWPYYPDQSMPSLSYEQLCEKWQQDPALGYPINLTEPDYPDGNQALKTTLQTACDNQEKVTLLICCPLTLLRNVLQESPELAAGIEQLIWMGGAVNGHAGNLDPNTLPKDIANPYAEWNVFWDPYAVAWVFENTNFPITLFPLNVTDDAKITNEFLASLKSQSATAKLSELAYQSYQLTLDQPFYCMWDVTAASYLARPDLFKAPSKQTLAIITDGYYQGTLINQPNGRKVDVVLEFADLQGFYNYVLQQLNQ